MNVEEARAVLGYTRDSSVMHYLKTGALRAREDGTIVDETVHRLAARRAGDAERMALFLKDTADLTAAERKLLIAKPPARKRV